MKRLCMQLSKKKKTKVHNIIPEQKCEIHDCLKRQMILFRLAGMFAVEGLGNPTIKGLRFKLSSFYGIYHFASFLGQIVITILVANWSYNNGYITSLIHVFYHVIGSVSMFQMMQLGKAWPILIRRLARIERHLRDIKTHNNTKKHCDSQLWIISTICFVEHSLSIIFFCKLISSCNLHEESGMSLFELYFTFAFPYLFNLTRYALWKTIIIKFINIQSLILCGLTDVIPMAFSLYLISYIRDLNTAISTRNNKDVRYWEKLRLYYTRLENMVGLVNHHLKAIVLVSFTNYLVFISMQLFYLLNFQSVKVRKCSTKVYSTGATTEQILYFLCSFTFLLSRALLVSLLAARVHTEAKKPLLTLFGVSTHEDSKEVQRFRLQIIYNPIALTGSLFSITKSTILKFFSTIMTYELVLLQLNENQKRDPATMRHAGRSMNETLEFP